MSGAQSKAAEISGAAGIIAEVDSSRIETRHSQGWVNHITEDKAEAFKMAHALSLGHSGVQVGTVERIIDFFNNDILPVVYDRGSLGASGDLAPLANLFVPLIGEGDVNYKGKRRTAKDVLEEFGWKPIKLMSKEGLALLNGTQFMSANGVFAVLNAFRISKTADLIGAISLDAYDGRIEPFMLLRPKDMMR